MADLSPVFTLGGFPCVVADPAAYPLAANKANSWRFVVGSAHGSGYVLMYRSDLNRPAFKKGGPLELALADGPKKFKVKKVWILSAFRVNAGGAPDDPTAVYLCKLVDWRYFLNRWSTSARALNVRNWAGGDPDRHYVRETVKAINTPHGWNDLLKLLWGDVVGLGPFRNVPNIKPPPPEDLHNSGQNAWRFLNEVLGLAGRVIVYDSELDTYAIKKLTIDATPLDADVAADLEFDARPFSSPACAAPEKIRVYFVKRLEDYGQENDTAATTNWATSNSFTWIDVPTKAPDAIKGTIAPVWAATPAVVQHGTRDTIANLVDVKATAREMADAWLLENGADALSRAHMTLSGLQKKWLPNDSIRETTVREFGAGLLTEVRKYPGMPELLPDFSWEPGAAGEPDENLQPIDTARKTLPNYPRLPNIVEVYDYHHAADAMIEANSSGVHPGYVRRVVAGQFERLEKCWILLCDDYPTKRGDVPAKNGDFYGPARLSGKHEHAGERLPLYVVRSSAATTIVQFRLLSPIQPGSSALATRIKYNATTGGYDAYGGNIIVTDWYSTPRGMWQAPALGSGLLGTTTEPPVYIEGFAQFRGNTTVTTGPTTIWGTLPGGVVQTFPQYEIIWMETLAWECEGYISGTPAGSIATGTVTAAWEQGKWPGATITLHDDQGFFPRWGNGALFKATRSEHNGQQNYWKVTNCQQVGITAHATLETNMCSSAATLVEGSFTVTSPSPFNLQPDPLPTSATNPRNHRGRAGDQVVLQLSGGAWEVTDVTLHDVAVIVQAQYAARKLEVKKLTIAAEYCGEVGDWETIFTAVPCTPPSP